MDKLRLTYLYEQYLAKAISEAELSELSALAIDAQFMGMLDELTVALWDIRGGDLPALTVQEAQIVYEEVVVQPQLKKRVQLWSRIAAAAAILLVLGFGLWFYTYQNKDHSLSVYQSDIAPGKTGATLTLGNGKKIILSDAVNGELAKESGVVITKAANGQLAYEIKDQNTAEVNQINTLSTANAETYQVKLPDGTSIWLNAASTLKYPASFARLKSRHVELSGEAYFEVAKDKAHPFIVESKGQQVEVLGTHFNISAYKDEAAIKTTLIEGSVKVISLKNNDLTSSNTNSRMNDDMNGRINDRHPEFISGSRTRTATINSNDEVNLKPNQQSTLNGNSFEVSNVDAEYATAWKNGFFLFNNETLESIMTKVSRWYDVKVTYTDPALKSKTFIGTINRFEKISKVLNMLEQTGGAVFSLEGNKIIVDNKK